MRRYWLWCVDNNGRTAGSEVITYFSLLPHVTITDLQTCDQEIDQKNEAKAAYCGRGWKNARTSADALLPLRERLKCQGETPTKKFIDGEHHMLT